MPQDLARLSQSIWLSHLCSVSDSALLAWSTGSHLPSSSSWYRLAAIPLGEASVTRWVFLSGF